MIFLDQPVNVGYSYGDSSVNTSPVAGKDVYAFLELFVNRFPKYADKPFHLAAEVFKIYYLSPVLLFMIFFLPPFFRVMAARETKLVLC